MSVGSVQAHLPLLRIRVADAARANEPRSHDWSRVRLGLCIYLNKHAHIYIYIYV